MHQIADWLEQLGMSEYGQRFAENGIGFAALLHLTDQDNITYPFLELLLAGHLYPCTAVGCRLTC